MCENNKISQEKEILRRQFAPLGLISGKIGPYVGRLYPFRVNGKLVYQQRIATLPKQYNTNKRIDLQDNRFRFKTTALFAKQLISHPQLKELWRIASKGKSSAYNYINKVNYPLTSPDAPSVNNLIVPVNTPLQINNLKVTPYAIKGAIPYKKNSTLIAFLSFAEPFADNDQKFRMLSVSLPVTSDTFTISVTKEIKELSLIYSKFTLFITLITGSKKRISTSGTFTTSGPGSLFISLPISSPTSNPYYEIITNLPLRKAVGDDIIVNLINNHLPRGDTNKHSKGNSSPQLQRIMISNYT